MTADLTANRSLSAREHLRFVVPLLLELEAAGKCCQYVQRLTLSFGNDHVFPLDVDGLELEETSQFLRLRNFVRAAYAQMVQLMQIDLPIPHIRRHCNELKSLLDTLSEGLFVVVTIVARRGVFL